MDKSVGLKIEHDEFTVTEDWTHEPDDEWGRPNTDTTHTVGDVYLCDDKYPTVTATFPVEVGDKVLIVYTIYSTGDSFHKARGANIEFVDVFSTEEKACECARTIDRHYEWATSRVPNGQLSNEFDKKEPYKVTLTRENGEQWKLYADWCGYFESLNDVVVMERTVKSAPYESESGRIRRG